MSVHETASTVDAWLERLAEEHAPLGWFGWRDEWRWEPGPEPSFVPDQADQEWIADQVERREHPRGV
jgi:hypothetical protein